MSGLAMSVLCCLLSAVSPSTAPPAASPSPSTVEETAASRLSARVAELRADVDEVAADVAAERSALHDEVAALERRRRELEERVAQLALSTAALNAQAGATERAVAALNEQQGAAQAPVRDTIARLRRLQARMPFRLHARRARVARVEGMLAASSAVQAASALWPVIIDEATLLKGQGRVRQAIDVDGTPVMAELMHIGPLVWWRAADGRVGVAELGVTDDTPRFTPIDDADARQRIQLFFEARKRGPLSGIWLLPSPMTSTSTPTSNATNATNKTNKTNKTKTSVEIP